jgi:uncharacterized membrane protein YphA (DoxX/SURF4 family)
MSIETRIPHSLRLPIFFLRLALGLNFFYVGWSVLFNQGLTEMLRGRSFGWLYAWLAHPTPVASIPSALFSWILLILGLMLIIGLFTRLASVLILVIVFASLISAITFTKFDPTQFVNDGIIVLIGLFIILFGKAGTYLGIDKFLHWSRRHHE